ncbi:beta strand repeat-containing protein [Brevundimonas lenta]|uniref:VCBS repeat-containing protein n=1 Tax=Brevundimonas lenta TaxID=424796 RepID=A0A7W6JB65_9CAUL|nr:Ig-like domain-containing protein [Brevundimonas lenta]MBB4081894.1 VCBS repeat-containing protein [Brevundimonas lenta]
MPVTGQLWFTTEAGDADTRIVRVNSDGSGQTINIDNSPAVDPLISSFVADVGLDTAAGFYFALANGGVSGLNAFLVRGAIGSSAAPTTVIDFADNIIVNGIQVDAINQRIYVGYQDDSGAAPANTGIRVYSYTAAGALTDLGFLVTAATDTRGNESGVALLDPRDFALDTSLGRLFYTELLTGGVASVGLFRLDLANPTVTTQLVSQTQFPDNGANGYIHDVEVDPTTDLVYFSTQSNAPFGGAGYNAAHNAIWYIDEHATDGTAVKVTLVGAVGTAFYPGDMTFDQNSRQLYVESEEGGAGSADDVIYVFQLNAAGTSATLINTISPSPAFTGSAANIQGMFFAHLATLGAPTGTSTAVAEQGAGVILLTGAPDITDVDGARLTGATVQITDGRPPSSPTDDHLGYGAAQQISGLIAGTNITLAWNASTGTLSLTGYDTIANYEAALAEIRFWSTGDNPTNYGANTGRTLTWTVNDGTPGVPAGSSNSSTTTINIAAVNDAPVNGVVSTASGNEGSNIAVSGLQVSDADSNASVSNLSVTLSVDQGVLTLRTDVAGGLTAGDLSGNGTATVTVTGTQTEINATLAAVNGLVYFGASFSGTATLTVVTSDGGNTGSGGVQSDTDAYSITVIAVNQPHTGGVSITGTATEDQVLTASTSTLADGDGLGTLHYQWQRDTGGGYVNVGSDSVTYTLGDADVGGLLRVVVSYTDLGGTAESATSASTSAIANVNDPHTGGASITGTATENQVLTAVSTIADADGVGTLHYLWQRNTGSGFVNVGLDQATYTLGDADVGGVLRTVIYYTDAGGTVESATSAATAAIAGVNDPHTGGASITGTATEDQVLTAVSTLADVDGLGTLHYQWQRDTGSGFVNVGADQATYTLGDADVGGLIRVVMGYTDGQGFAESATSASTAAIASINDPHTGGVSITGAAEENSVLTANTSTLADADGLGTLHYQWQRDLGSGFVNVGLDQATYTLGAVDIGGVVRVVVSYVDLHGTAESQASAATATVVIDNLPAVAVDDTASTGESAVLNGTVVGNDSDPDGPALTVSAVNGSAANVGTQITLASGALLTLNANGTYSYDPNGVFTHLPAGASDTDTFTYALLDGNTATVTLTITGVDSEGDVLVGGPGNNTLNGGAGVDTADYGGAPGGVHIRLHTGVGDDGQGGTDTLVSIEDLIGSAFNDILIGAAGDNVLSGGAGSDTLIGMEGNDTLVGGAGAPNQLQGGLGDDDYFVEANDTVVELPNQGHDRIFTTRNAMTLVANVEELHFTGAGNFTGVGNILDNTIVGGAGDDLLSGRGGNDTLNGGAGTDTVTYAAAAAGVSASLLTGAVGNDGDGGSDTLTGFENLVGSAFGDNLVGDNGVNVISGGTGNDIIRGNGGNDLLQGGPGSDYVSYSGATSGVVVRLDLNTAQDGTGGTDTIVAFENVIGSAQADMIVGDAAGNVLQGEDGADVLIGRGGGDLLIGGAGAANTLYGGAGDDLYVVTANDTIIELAGEGTDTVQTSRAYLVLAANIENLNFTGTGDFHGAGNASANVITGGAGRDSLVGGGGNDTLNGGDGHDTAWFTGQASDYLIEDLGGGQFRVTDSVGGRDGVDILNGIEQVRFLDVTSVLGGGAAPALTTKQVDGAQVLPAVDHPEVLPAVFDADDLATDGFDGLALAPALREAHGPDGSLHLIDSWHTHHDWMF